MSRRFVRTPVVPQMEDQDCGPACLASVLTAFGRHSGLHEVSDACGVSRDGVTAGAVIRTAARFGLRGYGRRVVRGEDRHHGLDALPVPAMVVVRGPHFAVYEGIRRGRVRVNDPTIGRYGVRPERFWDDFLGIAVGFERSPGFVPRRERFAFGRAMAGRIRGYRGALLLCVLVSLLVSVPGIAASLVLRAAMTLLDGPGGTGGLTVVAFVATGSVLLGTWLQQRVLHRVLETLSARSSARFLWRLVRLPGAFFHRRSLGGLVTRVQLNDGMAQLLSGRSVAAVSAALSATAYLGVLVWLDPQLAVVAATVAVLDVAALSLIGRVRSARLHALHTAQARRDAVAFAGVAAIETLKAEGSEEQFFTSWTGHQARVIRLAQDIASSTLGLFTLSTVLNTAAAGVTVVLGARQVLAGELDYPTLLAFILLTNAFLVPIGSLVGIGSELLVARAQAALLEDVEQAEPDPFLTSVLGAVGAGVTLRGAVALRDVTVGYDLHRPAVVNGIDFDAAPGEWVAVVGTSGSGKSTLARLLSGTLAPWQGRVLLDGHDRGGLPRAAVTSGVATVEQRVHLFAGTVRDNLTLWGDAADETLWAALRDADADDLVRRRGGLDAAVAEDARNLSGGERQRLEIARALVGGPAVLILDEATSALDADTELRVNARLRARGCTCIVFAHRLSTVRAADRVLVLAGGRLVQQGAPDELAAQGGPYRDLIGELA